MTKSLNLSLKKQWFDLMVTGEKAFEYRCEGKWIASRLLGKAYDTVRFVNGYGADKPYFVAEYKGYTQATKPAVATHGGIDIHIKPGDYIIALGNVLEVGNVG